MTKSELIALARDGKAHVEVAYTITRYCITRKGGEEFGRFVDYPAVFMSISNEDGGVYEDAAYFTDGVDEEDLTNEECDTLAEVIHGTRAPLR
jgi:hypothetical protein